MPKSEIVPRVSETIVRPGKQYRYESPRDREHHGLTVIVRAFEGSVVRVADVDGEWPEFFAWRSELTEP